jgi:hypothetical protein
MDNNISAWLDKADDVMLDDFDPNEDDSEWDILDNPISSDESVKNERDSEMSWLIFTTYVYIYIYNVCACLS